MHINCTVYMKVHSKDFGLLLFPVVNHNHSINCKHVSASTSCLTVESLAERSCLITCFLYARQAFALWRQYTTEQTDHSKGKY